MFYRGLNKNVFYCMQRMTVMLMGILCLNSCGSSPKKVEATFHSGHIGGGGYIIGIVQNPDKPEVMYAKSDVGGVFRSTNGGRSWQAVNDGMERTFHHFVRSLIMDPKDPDILYRASGELRAHTTWGAIHKTEDGGDTWTLLTDTVDFFGTGPTRMCGELLAVHPQNSNIIVAGGYSRGVWLSEDQGKTWEYKGLKGKRITFVQFDKASSHTLYIGTCGDKHLLGTKSKSEKQIDKNLSLMQDQRRGDESELYCSHNLWDTFDLVYKTDEVGFLDFVVCNNSRTLLISTSDGVLRSDNGGKDFVYVDSKYLTRGQFYQTLAISPLDNQTLYTAKKFSGKELELYYSKDYGKSWSLYSPGLTRDNLHEYPTYLGRSAGILGSSISFILPDCKDPDKLYMSNFWGVNITYDNGKNYYGHNFTGLEMTCGEFVEKHPTVPGRVILGMVDHTPMVSNDYGENWSNIKNGYGPTCALTASSYNPDFYLFSRGRRERKEGTPFIRFPKNDSIAEQVFHKKGNSYVSCIREDIHREGRFWLLQEGGIKNEVEDAGVFRSDDYGKTWMKMSNPYPNYITFLPYEERLIDQDLLPMVPYQIKNGNGNNKLLALDRVKPDVVYVGEYTEGIYRSDDAGKSWVDVSSGLPFKEAENNVLSFIYPDPLKEGVVYVGFWNEGLFRSNNFGQSWEKMYPTTGTAFNALSLSIDKGVMAMCCAENTHSSVPAQLLLSFDNGKTWVDIYDKSLGALNFKNIDLDAEKQRIYATTGGNGVYFIDYLLN